MKKLIISIATVSMLSSCTSLIPKDQFNLNIKSAPEANNGDNYLVIYEQPSSMQEMSQATYDTLSKQILDSNHQSKIIHPQDETDSLKFKTKNEPATIYFVMNRGESYNTWRYYIPNPAGNSWSCSIDDKGYTGCQKDQE